MEKLPGYPCSICQKSRNYSNKQNAKKGKDKPCNSCANSLKAGGQGMAYTADGQKLCNDCRLRPQKHNSVCQECSVARRKVYFREVMRFERYGVTKEWFEERFTGKCEICQCPVEYGSVNIDHCHTTGKVRGLLCHLCNKGLGAFKDNLQALRAAVTYLEENQ